MLKINEQMQIVDINTEVVMGKLFRSEKGSITFRKSWYIEYLSEDEKSQIEDILIEINEI